MKINTPRFLTAAFLVTALAIPMAVAPTALRAEDKDAHRYHDKKRNADHDWNDREDQAYRKYGTEKHRGYVEFGTLKPNDQQNYWNWRHTHSDSLLKIEIH